MVYTEVYTLEVKPNYVKVHKTIYPLDDVSLGYGFEAERGRKYWRIYIMYRYSGKCIDSRREIIGYVSNAEFDEKVKEWRDRMQRSEGPELMDIFNEIWKTLGAAASPKDLGT